MNGDRSSGGRTFVLKHGAWHGGWCWRRVEDLLRAQGRRAIVDAICTKQPYGALTGGLRLTGARERVPKKAYVLATGWANAAFPVFAEKVKDDPDWRYYEVECGHDVMLDEPERLAQILQEAA